MPRPSPFHDRTAPLCQSLAYKDWAGFHAVCHYGACGESEYHAVRHSAGMLDISPLYKYEISGPDAASYLSYLWTRDVSRLSPGRVTYSALCDDDGFLIDDGTIARLDEQRFRCTTASPSLHWFRRHLRGFDAQVTDTSEAVAALAIQGPRSRALLDEATDGAVSPLKFFRVGAAELGGVPVEVSRTGYTGDLGYEVWLPAERAVEVWDHLTQLGKRHALMPMGLDALDMTRVEAGFILQDVDYYSSLRAQVRSRKSTPWEMGLGWTVNLDRERFLGRDALAASRATPKWQFVGLEIDWEELEMLYEREGLPPHLPAAAWRTPIPIYSGSGQVGQATSGTWSPLLKKNLALASVLTPHAATGTRLRIEQTVEFRRHRVTATVVERPFFDPERKRS